MDFNKRPYFDDYNATGGARENNYHQILFKPSYAVQARELTQSQSILQDQISRFGSHIFKDGSLVKGAAFYLNTNLDYVMIKDLDINGYDITMESLKGLVCVGQTNGIVAEIIDVVSGTELSSSPKAIYLQYRTSTGIANIKTFIRNEYLSVEGYGIVQVLNVNNAIGKSARFTIDEGVIFTRNSFVKIDKQSVFLNYYGQVSNGNIGLSVEETIINAEDDIMLVDPAQGSYNYNALGADRYQIYPKLTYLSLNDTLPENFYLLFTIKNNVVEVNNATPQYNDIMKEIAKRTYDESGNYVVNPYKIDVIEHLKTSDNNGYTDIQSGGDFSKLVVNISPGKSYVLGYEVENITTKSLIMDKSTDYGLIETQSISFSFGTYLYVNDVCGGWNYQSSGTVSLRSLPANAVTNGTYNLTSMPGVEIGTAKFRAIQYNNGTIGTATCVYRLYLFDITINSAYSIYDIKSVIMNISSRNSCADVVLESGKSILYDSQLNKSIFKFPKSNIKNIKDDSGNTETTYTYNGIYTAYFTSNSATINTKKSSETFPFSLGALTSTELKNILILDNDTGRYISPVAATLLNNNSLKIDISDNLVDYAIVYVKTQKNNANAVSKSLQKNRYVKLDLSTAGINGRYNLGLSDVFKINNIYKGTTYSTSNEDITDWFSLDNGQRDNIYDHSSIQLISGVLSSTDKLLIKLDYFEHDYSTGSGYYTIDSYPIDDSGIISNTITTSQLQLYTSIKTNETFDLRNCIDFRLKKINTATNTTNIDNASINPPYSNTFYNPPSGNNMPIPDGFVIVDYTVYYSRIDLVCVDKSGNFFIKKGVASDSPKTPIEPSDSMAIGKIFVSAYPSLSPYYASIIGKYDNAVKIEVYDKQRYTMSDISVLENRISNLEYYVSLTQLEQEIKNKKIYDENGLDRYKNGFVAEPFIDHTISNISNPYYSCSIDKLEGGLYPTYNINNVKLVVSSTTNIKV